MKRCLLVFAILLTTVSVFAQDGPPDNKHGIMVRVAELHLSPDENSSKLAEVDRETACDGSVRISVAIDNLQV